MTAASAALARPALARPIAFQGGGAFYDELKALVDRHVADPMRRRRAQRQMYLKTAVIGTWLLGSWAALVFAPVNAWQAVLLAISLGLAMAGVGFNITHDANHGSYSPHRRLNRVMRFSLDLIGASSYVWRVRHNVAHHTYTNVAGADSDIDSMPLARFAPEQPLRFMHRFQHIYMWLLYGLFAVNWQTTGDVLWLMSGRVGESALARPRGVDLAEMIVGKAIFLSMALVVPMLFHPWWQVLALFGVVSFVLALTLAIVFQLAHCVEEAAFPSRDELAGPERAEWARHQVATTVDFAPGNRLLTWYLGGLNYQVEHHLFPRVCHIHYPGIAPIVSDVCGRMGIEYHVHPTFRGALASHTRWLREMGRPA